MFVFYRDTTLQALRGCITGAGSKMSNKIRGEVVQTLEGLLASTEDSTRTTGAACLGALCQCLSQDELAIVLQMNLLGQYHCEPRTLALIMVGAN